MLQNFRPRQHSLPRQMIHRIISSVNTYTKIDTALSAAGYAARPGKLANGQTISRLIVPATGVHRDTDGNDE